MPSQEWDGQCSPVHVVLVSLLVNQLFGLFIIFFWSTKINEKKTEQLVDQETDQNHMDGTKDDEIAGTKSSTSQSQHVFGQIKNLKGNENKFALS